MKPVFYFMFFCLLSITSYSQKNSIELSHYIFPEFTRGVILMKTGVKNEALLNYNSLTEEMIFENKGKKLTLNKAELDQVDTVFIKGRKFFLLNNKFVELVYHSTVELYAMHKCKAYPPGQPSGYNGTSQVSAISSYSSLVVDGKVYELKLPDDYVINPYIDYCLKKDGELKNFISIRQLMKLYDDKKNLFKAYIKEHDVNYNNQESIVQFIEYLETH